MVVFSNMGKKPKYYRSGEEYLALTGESPKGFKGVLFVCLTGGSPGDIKEDLVDENRLKGWEHVPDKEVPDDWFAAFGLEKREQTPTPEQPEPRADVPVLKPIIRSRTDNEKLCAAMVVASAITFMAMIAIIALVHSTM